MASVGQKLEAGPVGWFRLRRLERLGCQVTGAEWGGGQRRSGRRQGPSRCRSSRAAAHGSSTWNDWLLAGTVASGHVASLATVPQRVLQQTGKNAFHFLTKMGEHVENHFHWPVLSVISKPEEAQGKRKSRLSAGDGGGGTSIKAM